MNENTTKPPFKKAKYYSRGPSGKGLHEKYTTEKQVLSRITRLKSMIHEADKKIRQIQYGQGRKFAELQRLKQLATEKDYVEVLEVLKKTPLPKEPKAPEGMEVAAEVSFTSSLGTHEKGDER